MQKWFLSLMLASAFGVAHADNAPTGEFVNHKTQKVETLEAKKGTVQVINFWAAYCPPCRREVPIMSQWYQKTAKKQGIQLVGISVDSHENASKFLKEMPTSYPIWDYAGKDALKMMKALGNKVGGLPFTVVKTVGCSYEQAIIGEMDSEKLSQAVKQVQTKCASI